MELSFINVGMENCTCISYREIQLCLKPAEYTSLNCFIFAELCQKANFPEGVINIITGDGLQVNILQTIKILKKLHLQDQQKLEKNNSKPR